MVLKLCAPGLAAFAVGMALLCHSAVAQPRPGTPVRLWALTAQQELVQFDAATPSHWLQRKPLRGLVADEVLVGLDFRVARGVLYGVSQRGRVYTIDTTSGQAQAVGEANPTLPLTEGPYGVDFNPVADRIRLVNAQGLNARLHPDTGAHVDGDPKTDGVQTDAALAFVDGDPHAGRAPEVVAAAYTYHPRNDKLTTNYAIDRARGALLVQGSHEEAQPVVSPNTGRLTTVGLLGTGPLLDASFDITDVGNRPLAVLRTVSDPRATLFQIDLTTGQARSLGVIGEGGPLLGLATEP